MRILSVDNPPEDLWSFSDATYMPLPPDYEVDGVGNFWIDSQMAQQSFPSNFAELDAPSFGDKIFLLGSIGTIPEDFTVNVEVKCITEGTIPIGLRTRTFFESFEFGNADEYPSGFEALFEANFD